MTWNMPRIAVPRVLMVLAPTLLVAAVAIGIVGGIRATGASAGESTGAPAVAAVPAVVTVIPACLTDDLTGTVFGQPRDGHSAVRDAVLRLTNTSGRTCQVRGWPDMAMVTPPGELVRVPTRKVPQAGGGARIVLAPAGSAWSRVEWDSCDAGHRGCGVGVALQYIIDPDSTGTVADLTGVPEADLDGITMKAMRVGPFQQTRTAALD